MILIDDILALHLYSINFTITWRRLSGFDSSAGARNDSVRDLFIDREAFDAWGLSYRSRLNAEASVDQLRRPAMDKVNPKYVLRNHLADVAIQRAKLGDFSETQKLNELLRRPFDEQTGDVDNTAYADFPPDWAQHLEVSCSS